MPSGGPRGAKPGGTYPNRTDMPGKPLPVTTVPGQEYGAAGAQAQAQAAVPMAGAPTGTGVPPQAGPVQPTGPLPGSFGDFRRPTERPNEPITAGLARGAGPGPEALGQAPDTLADQLHMVSQMPGAGPEVASLLAYVTGGRR